MHSDLAATTEVDESMWLYFACDCGSDATGSFARSVAELCRDLGWHVCARTETGGAAGPRELLHADACIADLSCVSEEVLAELAAVRRAGRPILLLHPAGVAASSPLDRLLAGYERARVVRFSDSEEGLMRLQETFTDQRWQTLLRETITFDDA